MRKFKVVGFLLLIGLLNHCSNGQPSAYNLSATEFNAKIMQLAGAPILDVRTPGEYAESHLANAINIDWSRKNFASKIAVFDKSKPVFVYCLSGARSSSAASHMRSIGFKEVYELNGGLLKWRNANLPETALNTASSSGMSLKDFNNLIVADKIVLVDFYADWCGPCKKMEPYLKEISNDMKDRVVLVRIDTDDNQGLARELKIDAIPVLQVYKNKKLTWNNIGYVEKEVVLKQLQIR